MNGLFNMSLEQKETRSLMYMADNHTITDRSIIVRKIDDTHIHAYCLKRQQAREFKCSNVLAAGKRRKGEELMLKNLSARQETMLQFIDDYVSAKNYPPSIREIGDAVELKSSSAVKSHLDRLKASGYVTWEQGKPRTLNVVKRNAITPMKLNA